MKTIVKKTRCFTVTITLCLVVVTLFVASGCDDTKVQPNYTVSFAGEGIGIEIQSIPYGYCATEPESPEREGCNFAGWFTDNVTFTNEWDFKTNIVTQDITLYAKWEKSINYPMEISFSEYSLAETFCEWANLEHNDEIVVINSYEELDKYVTCLDGNYLEIDFSKNTLLLASGTSDSGISYSTAKILMQLERGRYELEVELEFNNLGLVTPWQIAIIIDKLDVANTIDLKIKYVIRNE